MVGSLATRTCQPDDCKGQAWRANQPAGFTPEPKRFFFLRPKACAGSAREFLLCPGK